MNTRIGLLREKAPQCTIALYKDQEERIKKLSKKLGKKLTKSELVREGLDYILAELEKSL